MESSVLTGFMRKGTCLSLIAAALSGCAGMGSGPAIKAGDTVGIHFTCRLPNAAVAISSEKDVTADPLLIKAPFFRPRSTDQTLEVVAGPAKPVKSVYGNSFEDDVLQGIAARLVGLNSGESHAIELVSSDSDHQPLKLNRIRHAEKLKVVTIEDFKSHTNFEPVIGQPVEFPDSLPGVVKDVKDNKVTIDFTAPEGTVVNTPLGPGRLRDAGKRYDIVIDAKQGDLMRMGMLVGRIKSVDDQYMEFDFTRTFAGENLRCDVTAEIKKMTEEQATKGSASGASATAPAQAASEQTDTAPAKGQKTAAFSPEETQQGVKILQKAMSDAAKEGKTSIGMDTDTLLGPVGKGDLVTVRFTAREPGGAPLSLPETMPKQGAPMEIIAGNQEVFPGLGDAVIGMTPGEKKEITLTAEKAYGPRDPAKTATYPVTSTVPLKITMPADNYVKQFNGFPTMGKELKLSPMLSARVTEVNEKEVTLELTAKDGAQYDEPFGTITIAVGKDSVTMKLAPKLGAPFDTGDKQGRISAVEGDKFTVDYNNPLAGKTIVVELQVDSATKAADIRKADITWIENQEAGLAEAKKEGKPLFLLLYADWCHWCQKTQTETLVDPRIGKLRDKFVWMKLNSDKEKKYKEQYGQNGFPLMVVLGPDGTILRKIDGYRDAVALKAELDGVLVK